MFDFSDCCSETRTDTANQSGGVNDGDEVRAPLPVIRETLYDNVLLYGYVFNFAITLFTLETIGFWSHKDASCMCKWCFIEHVKCKSLGFNYAIAQV